MGVYSNTEIMAAIDDGRIVSVPFNPAHVSEASLDFTLGHYFYKQEDQPEASGIYNPFDEKDVERYFKGPLEAMPHKEWCQKNKKPLFQNIPEDHPIIVLHMAALVKSRAAAAGGAMAWQSALTRAG